MQRPCQKNFQSASCPTDSGTYVVGVRSGGRSERKKTILKVFKMAIPTHVRRFSDYHNQKIESVSGNVFDKKSFYLNVRSANKPSKVVIITSHGHNDDPDVCNTGEFLALQPKFAAELACRLEDAIIASGYDFERHRSNYLARGKSGNTVSAD